MAARASMAALIQKVRFEIGDVGSEQVFTDEEIQAQLDRRRRDVTYQTLTTRDVRLPGGGAITYTDFWAANGDWEDDVVLVDSQYNVVTSTESEPLLGHWTFSPGRTSAYIYLSGRMYDVYSTAADLCVSWLGRIKMDVSFTSQGRNMQRKERIENLQALEKSLRSRGWVTTANWQRTDIAPQRSRRLATSW